MRILQEWSELPDMLHVTPEGSDEVVSLMQLRINYAIMQIALKMISKTNKPNYTPAEIAELALQNIK